MLIKIPSNTPIAVLQNMLAAGGMTLKPQGDRYELAFLEKGGQDRKTNNEEKRRA